MEYVRIRGKKYYVKDGILDFSGVEYEDLISTDIWPFRFELSKIEGLTTLKNLIFFRLPSVYIYEIESLESLINLQELDLNGNEITEIKGLDSLVNLKKLNLSGNPIGEIKGLKNLTNLQKFHLSSTEIREIKGLNTLINLKELKLGENHITEIKGLKKLKKLKRLDLSDNQITEIKGLETLMNLQKLDLHGNQFTEIKGLENLKNLKKLEILFDSNELDLFYGLKNLEELEIPQILLEELKKLEEKTLIKIEVGIEPELYQKWKKIQNSIEQYRKQFFEGKASKDETRSTVGRLKSNSIEINYYYSLKKEYFIQAIIEYCRQKRKKLEIMEKDRIKKLKGLIEKSSNVSLKQIKNTLKMDTHTFNNKIIDWADEFNFIIDGDYLVINKDTVSDFIDALDK